MLQKILFVISLILFSSFSFANNINEIDENFKCFKPQLFNKSVNANLSSFGGYGFDVQYIKINKNISCRVDLTADIFSAISKTGDIRNTFEALGEYNVYGNYTVFGVPPRDRNILYKRDSNHIIKNKRSGYYSEIVKFEMQNNDAREKLKNFNIVIKMDNEDKKKSEKSNSKQVFISGKFVEGKRNFFIKSEDDYIIFVNIYPIKYPIPKR